MTITITKAAAAKSTVPWLRDALAPMPQPPTQKIAFVPTLAKPHWTDHNPAARALIARGVEQAERGELIDAGSFAQFADLEIDD